MSLQIDKVVEGNLVFHTHPSSDIVGGGTPGGSDTQLQFNDGGAFGGNAKMVFSKAVGGNLGLGASDGGADSGVGGDLALTAGTTYGGTGKVKTVVANEDGEGYAIDDILTLTEGNADCTVKVTEVINYGYASGIVLNNPGSGYAADEIVLIVGGDSNATAYIVSVDGSGAITGIIAWDWGSNYTSGNNVELSGGSGAGGTVDTTVTGNGIVTGVSLVTAGSGYITDEYPLSSATTGGMGAGATMSIQEIEGVGDAGGDVTITAGAGSLSGGAGGAIAITAGASRAGYLETDTGGNIDLVAGASLAEDGEGKIRVKTGGGAGFANLNTLLLTEDRKFSYPDSNGTIALTTDIITQLPTYTSPNGGDTGNGTPITITGGEGGATTGGGGGISLSAGNTNGVDPDTTGGSVALVAGNNNGGLGGGGKFQMYGGNSGEFLGGYAEIRGGTPSEKRGGALLFNSGVTQLGIGHGGYIQFTTGYPGTINGDSGTITFTTGNIDNIGHSGAITLYTNECRYDYSGEISLKTGNIIEDGKAGTVTLHAGDSSNAIGFVDTATVSAGGLNYVVGNTLTISGGDGNAQVNVDTVDGSGTITGITMIDVGSGYISGSGVVLTGGDGDGNATVNITATGLADNTGGDVEILSGSIYQGRGNGGKISLTAGDGVLSGTGGAITLQAGSSHGVTAKVDTVVINAGGTGYVVGDDLTISGGGGNATVSVDSVNGSGVITGITLTNPGDTYTAGNGVALTGGTGDGFATVNITVATDANDGGHVVLIPGNIDGGTGTIGGVKIVNPSSGGGDKSAILNVEDIDSSDKTFTFPNESGTLALQSAVTQDITVLTALPNTFATLHFTNGILTEVT